MDGWNAAPPPAGGYNNQPPPPMPVPQNFGSSNYAGQQMPQNGYLNQAPPNTNSINAGSPPAPRLHHRANSYGAGLESSQIQPVVSVASQGPNHFYDPALGSGPPLQGAPVHSVMVQQGQFQHPAGLSPHPQHSLSSQRPGSQYASLAFHQNVNGSPSPPPAQGSGRPPIVPQTIEVQTMPMTIPGTENGSSRQQNVPQTIAIQTMPITIDGASPAPPPSTSSLLNSFKIVGKTVPLQPGQKIAYSSTGQPYISGPDASQEHQDAKVSIFSPPKRMEEVYGKQVTQYFNFLKFIICSNIIFTCIGFISYGFHLDKNVWRLSAAGIGPSQISGTTALDVLFISTYQPSNDVSVLSPWPLSFSFHIAFWQSRGLFIRRRPHTTHKKPDEHKRPYTHVLLSLIGSHAHTCTHADTYRCFAPIAVSAREHKHASTHTHSHPAPHLPLHAHPSHCFDGAKHSLQPSGSNSSDHSTPDNILRT